MIEIRVFSQEETEAAVQLWEACGLTRPWNDPRKDIARKLAVQPQLFLLAHDEERIVGSVMAGYDGHRGWLYYLAVSPAYQNGGIGRMLVREAELRLEALGCPKVNLQVRRTNTQAAGFYESLGYSPDDVVSFGRRLIPDD